MILLVLAFALTQAQQAKHDADELAIYQHMKVDEEAVWQIWRPSAQLLSDYRAVRRCYVQFHLYKVDSCDKELTRLDRDLSGAKE